MSTAGAAASVAARVIVRGKRVKVTRRNGRHTALINLRNLPPGRFSVKIRRELGPLRTRAPKSARD